jgi:hypothetical protein
MPKLNGLHILERLNQRLAQLEAGEEIAAKEIRCLLTAEQQQELEDAWTAQQQLRKVKRVKTTEQEKELGWKTKREVRIEVFSRAAKAAFDGMGKEMQKLQAEATRRRLRIYLDALEDAKKMGKDPAEATNYANNELTRAGLQRMDSKQKMAERIQHKREAERYIRLAGSEKD